MIPAPTLFAAAVVYAIYIGYLAFVCRGAWWDFRRVVPSESFHFSITDIWAAMLGLTPSVLLAAAYIKDQSEPLYLAALLLLFPAQLTWMFKGRLAAKMSSAEVSQGASAARIIAYALIAIPVTAIYVLAFWMCLPALILYFVLYFRRDARQKV